MKKLLLIAAMGVHAIASMATESWTVKAPMPSGRAAFGIACIDSMIYCIGGMDVMSNVHNTVYAYNMNTDTWITTAAMPTMRMYFQVAVANGKLYAIGGTMGSAPMNVVEEYDPATNTWTTKAPMPTGRWEFSTAVWNNKIYAAGGGLDNTETEEYDVASNTWTTKTPMNQGKIQENGAAATGGKLYFLGGKNLANTEFYDSTLVYDIATNSWGVAANMPGKRFEGAAAVSHGEIYYMCGGTTALSGTAENTNYRYNPATGAWTAMLPAIARRTFCQAVTAPNGHIFLVGGVDSANTIRGWNHEYTPETPVNVNEVRATEVAAYPNPSHGILNMTLPVDAGTVTGTTATNAAGQAIPIGYQCAGTTLDADVSHLPAGMYVVTVITDRQRYTSKVTVR